MNRSADSLTSCQHLLKRRDKLGGLGFVCENLDVVHDLFVWYVCTVVGVDAFDDLGGYIDRKSVV